VVILVIYFDQYRTVVEKAVSILQSSSKLAFAQLQIILHNSTALFITSLRNSTNCTTLKLLALPYVAHFWRHNKSVSQLDGVWRNRRRRGVLRFIRRRNKMPVCDWASFLARYGDCDVSDYNRRNPELRRHCVLVSSPVTTHGPMLCYYWWLCTGRRRWRFRRRVIVMRCRRRGDCSLHPLRQLLPCLHWLVAMPRFLPNSWRPTASRK
jgi:hypothetical protein